MGDVIEVNANERIPADLLLLYTTEKSGTVFLRTDQLDGETDWKHRRAVHFSQKQLAKIESNFERDHLKKSMTVSVNVSDYPKQFTQP